MRFDGIRAVSGLSNAQEDLATTASDDPGRRMAEASVDLSAETRSVIERRLEVVLRMLDGAARYEDVLEHHAEDFLWLSAAGPRVGREQALAHNAERIRRIPPRALAGTRVLSLQTSGEYAFVLFKTDAVPFGTDTYRVSDGKVVFQSNAVYLPGRAG